MTAPDPTPHLAGDDLCPRCGRELVEAWLVCAWCGTPLAVAAELPEGSRLGAGRYQVLRVLGRGGFGITYEVGDRRLKRRVAMKELFPDSAVRHGSLVLTHPQARLDFRAARERFMREARVLARFTHPGIVRVYEVFEEHGTAYMIMELLRGRTLVEILHDRGHPFDEEEVLDVAARVAAALRPVHAAGVLHRDVNPANVMLTNHGRIVVIDFGLVRDYDQSRTDGMTRMVTPGYAPLEQYRGEGRFGPPTDVYGLAATCYRLATGQVPVSAVERDGGRELPAPHRLNSGISKQVSDAILDGLELDPGHRPRDLDSFLARLGVTRLPDEPRSVLVDGLIDEDPDLTVIEPRPPTPDGDRTLHQAPRGPDATVHEDQTRQEDLTRHDHPTRHGDPTRHDEAGSVVAAQPVFGHRRIEPRPPAGPDSPVAMGGVAPAGRLPGPIGPHQPGRRKLTVPAVAVALAAASVAPVAVTTVLVLVVLPWLATVGDGAVQRMRDAHGLGSGWAARRLGPATLAPARFVRNVAVSFVRALPMVGVGAALLGGWHALRSLDVSRSLLDLSLRAIGLIVVGVLLATLRDGSSRFRTGFGVEDLVRRWLRDGRTDERVVVGWVVAVALVAGALWLSPDPFPIR